MSARAGASCTARFARRCPLFPSDTLTHANDILSPLRSKSVFFCNKECQAAAWKSHKAVCFEPRKVYDLKCSTCGAWGENLVGESGKCNHCGLL